MTEAAVDFDTGPYTSNPALKILRRAALSYREQEAAACQTLVYTQGGFLADTLPCYTNARGDREAKPGGCQVLTVPPEDWVAHPPDRRLETLPINFPKVGPGAWDVTSLVERRVNPGLAAAAPSPPNNGHGFLLVGTPILVRRLPADDNTRCASFVSDLRLTLTYTVPPTSAPGRPQNPLK